MRQNILIALLIVNFAGIVYAQNTETLDDAIKASADRIMGQVLMRNAFTTMGFTETLNSVTIAILDISAPSVNISEYIGSELTKHFLVNPRFRLIDRQNLDRARNELNFNMSGEVSDETAQSIGRFIGAQIVVFGSLKKVGNIYRMQIQAITVETAEVQGIYTANITESELKTIFGTIEPPVQRPSTQRQPIPRRPPPDPPEVAPVISFFWGMGGGNIFGFIAPEIGLQPGIALDSDSKDNYFNFLLDIAGGMAMDFSQNPTDIGFAYNLGGVIEYRFADVTTFGIGGGMGGLNDYIFPYIKGTASFYLFDGAYKIGLYFDYNFDYGFKFGFRWHLDFTRL